MGNVILPPSALLVSRIGPRSLHPRWIGEARQFDVLLSAWDPALPVVEGVHFEHRPGHKVKGYAGILRDHRDLWQRYDHICFMDEDIDTDCATLNRMFALCRQHDLMIAQPALSHDSHFTHAALLQQPAFRLRHVNFIEMMLPVFRRDALERIAPLYDLGLESGIDLIWCNLLAGPLGRFAVLDEISVRHSAPVGGQRAENGFTGTRRYEEDIETALQIFGLPWFSAQPFSALDRRGRLTRSRLRFLFSAMRLVPATFTQRPYSGRARAILVHLKHLALQRAVNRQPVNVLEPVSAVRPR